MSFICTDCNKDFKYKSHYLRHVNGKFDCIEKTLNDDDIGNLYATQEETSKEINNTAELISKAIAGYESGKGEAHNWSTGGFTICVDGGIHVYFYVDEWYAR